MTRRRNPKGLPNIRRPTVANQFYEGDAEALREQIKNCFLHDFGPGKLPEINLNNYPRSIVGLISPHAGYMYSGPVAATAFNDLAFDGKPETIVLLGPNHTGYGSALSIMNKGIWQTPLGDLEVDSKLLILYSKKQRFLISMNSHTDMNTPSKSSCLFYNFSTETHSKLYQYAFKCRITIQLLR